jgi:hypothetical protein
MVAISTHHLPTTRLRLVPPPQSGPAYGLRRLVALLALTVALALAVTLADAAFGALSATPEGSARSAGADPAATAEVHVVQPGDTLWSIAAAVAPDADPRAVVDQLVDLNGSATISVGQRVVLP